jgi:hypothetical protein
MSSSASKVSSSKTKKKKTMSADKGVLSHLVGDVLISPSAKPAPPGVSQPEEQHVQDVSGGSPPTDEDESPSCSLFATSLTENADYKQVVFFLSVETPHSAQLLLDQGDCYPIVIKEVAGV